MIGEIKRYIRDDGPIKVSRGIKELGIKVKELQTEYFYKKGEEISIEEISKKLKIAKEDISLALEATNTVESIDSTYYRDNKDGNSINLIERLSNNIDEEEIITNKMTLEKVINVLKPRDKEIILLRFYKEKTQTQVAKILGITQVQVSRLEKRILKNMKEMILGSETKIIS